MNAVRKCENGLCKTLSSRREFRSAPLHNHRRPRTSARVPPCRHLRRHPLLRRRRQRRATTWPPFSVPRTPGSGMCCTASRTPSTRGARCRCRCHCRCRCRLRCSEVLPYKYLDHCTQISNNMMVSLRAFCVGLFSRALVSFANPAIARSSALQHMCRPRSRYHRCQSQFDEPSCEI